jgi:hypothetical protein
MLRRFIIGFVIVAIIITSVVVFRRSRATGGGQVEGSVRQARIERGELVVSGWRQVIQ